MTSAVVVGAGPNGLAAAVRLAQHGLDVEVLEAADDHRGRHPHQRADRCRACCTTTARPSTRWASDPRIWPTLDLERYGLRWRWPEIDCAHPLDSGEAGLLWRSIDQTAEGLGA